MGRNNKKYKKDLKQQVQEKLEWMLKNGEGVSKSEMKKKGLTKNMISTAFRLWMPGAVSRNRQPIF